MNLKQNLSKKLKKTGGFTLIEMLIVVAIIAILVAVSIPMVSTSLNKARTATDDANERAAKAAALLTFMNTEPLPSTVKYYCYDASTGKATETAAADSCSASITDYGQSESGHVHVTVNPTSGETTISWVD